jgi:hypothetical protein
MRTARAAPANEVTHVSAVPPFRLALICIFIGVVASFMSTAPAAADDLQTSLLKAITDRDVAAARAALDKGADPNAAGEFGRTPLHEAAKESAEIVELLLVSGAKPNALDGDGRTPLHLAYSDSAALLLRHKADFLILDKKGNSALHTAAEADAQMCRLLVEAGIPVDARNNSGLTPLHFAALQANKNAADYLLSKGADINAQTLAPYSYKWTYIAWDVQGMEDSVPARSSALTIARNKHRRSKWTTGRYDDFAKFLLSRGAMERRLGAAPRWLMVASPLAFVGFFWGLFHLDARMRGWDELAVHFPARVTPSANLRMDQDGSVGRIGTIQLKKMLRAAATPDGLYLAMPRWVVAAHPPLLIPWSRLQLESCTIGPAGGKWLQLKVAAPVAGRITLRGGIAASVLEHVPPAGSAACG